MLTLITLVRQCLSGFSTVKLLFSPPSILYFLHGSHYGQLRLKEWGVMRREYLPKLFVILMYGRFVYSPQFIYLFMQSFIWAWTRTFIYTLGYDPILYFVDLIVSALANGSVFSCLLCSFDIPTVLVGWLVLALPCFLALQDAPGSSCMPRSVNQPFFRGLLVIFIGEWH